MMNLKGKELDEFFRKGLSNGDIPFEETNWLKLEKRLKRNKRRNTIAWITVSGIAAMLLLTLSVSKFFFADEKTQPMAKVEKKQLQKTTPAPISSGATGENNSAKATLEETKETTKKLTDLAITSSTSGNYRTIYADEKKSSKPLKNLPSEVLVTQSATNAADTPQPITTAPSKATQNIVQNNQDKALANANSDQVAPQKDTVLAAAKTNEPFRSGGAFSVSLLAGPDINGVNSLKSNRGGLSFGVMLSYRLSKTLSISTGALYAKKVYDTEFKYYKPNSSYVFPNTPKLVNADCRVLDIPLNINFTALSKAKNAVALSAGISSYIMLNEGYSFTYETPYTRGPKAYYITNQNKHYLGILNFAAAYERKISEEVSIGFQPYVKIPVTDIGYGNVKLLSTGVSTSIKLNILSKNK